MIEILNIIAFYSFLIEKFLDLRFNNVTRNI